MSGLIAKNLPSSWHSISVDVWGNSHLCKLFLASTQTKKLTVEDVDEGEDEPAHVNLSLEFLFELSFGRR